jgi:hypothetical protein
MKTVRFAAGETIFGRNIRQPQINSSLCVCTERRPRFTRNNVLKAKTTNGAETVLISGLFTTILSGSRQKRRIDPICLVLNSWNYECQ